MTDQQDTLPCAQVESALEVWFFRELPDEQRRSLFRLAYGERYASEATVHSYQRLLLRRVLRDIAAEQAKPSAGGEAGGTDQEVMHLAHILEEWDMKDPPNEWTGHSYEDIARDALTRLAQARNALRANAPEAQGEVLAEKINAASFAQLWVNYGDVKAERDELREALTRADACLRRPGAADHRVIQALAYTALASGAGDEG